MSDVNKAVVFSEAYVCSIKKRLKIHVDESGQGVFVHDRVSKRDIRLLRSDLSDIWDMGSDACAAVASSEGAILQSAAYGLVNDFDLLLKSGFMIGDRVVLWDYLYGRMLRDRDEDELDMDRLSVIANNLAVLHDLAKDGSLVVLPHPLEWHGEAANLAAQLGRRFAADQHFHKVMGLAACLAVANDLHLQPYTIAESAEEYARMIGLQHACRSAEVGGAQECFETASAALLSARLLTDERFEAAIGTPLGKFAQVILERKEFYAALRQRLSGASLKECEYKLEDLADQLHQDIRSWTAQARRATGQWSIYGGVIAATLGLLSAAGVATTSCGLAAALVALSSAATACLPRTAPDDGVITAVFSRLIK